MNLNLANFPHRSGAVLNPNLTPENIRLGDILTHRYDHHKVVVACIDGSHLLLVDKDGRISRQRIRRVIGRYSRRANDIHGLNNARLALVKAVNALDTDNRFLSRMGLRMAQWVYLDNIYHAVRH